MPAVLDDPAGPTLYRVSGGSPFPDPDMASLPEDIVPRKVTLRDRQTVATIVPFASRRQLPQSLLAYLCDQFNKEIEGGDTYPMMDAFSTDGFADYWFQNFGAVMLLGHIGGAAEVAEGEDWSKACLGSFCIKPNYPGRSSHVCNASFIVTDASRNRGVGRLMGESYIDWAPRLGYTYSVFNLVYETNVASCRIWDALGFKRIGRVKGCGNLRSHPGRLIDAIIYGRDLGAGDGEELVSEERFDKIKFYLKTGKYPNGADRAEKSRLRSAATHYKLVDEDKLMLRNKEVISDPVQQYDIARSTHALHHGGINKTTATISEKYHWSRIKETVSDVIRNCIECKDQGKTPNPGSLRKATVSAGTSAATPTVTAPAASAVADGHDANSAVGGLGPHLGRVAAIGEQAMPMDSVSRGLRLPEHAPAMMPAFSQSSSASYADPNDISVMSPSRTLQNTSPSATDYHGLHHPHHHHHHHHHQGPMLHDHSDHHHHSPHEPPSVYQPIDPQIINNTTSDDHDSPFDQYHAHAEDFQALLNATEDHMPGQQDSEERAAAAAAEAAAEAAAMEMLIDHRGDDDDDDEGEEDMGANNRDVDVVMNGGGDKTTSDQTMSDALVDGDDKADKGRSIYDLELDGPGG